MIAFECLTIAPPVFIFCMSLMNGEGLVMELMGVHRDMKYFSVQMAVYCIDCRVIKRIRVKFSLKISCLWCSFPCSPELSGGR
jgi:hypothetical protein